MKAEANNKLIIFTDGACSGNPGPGGWGAILASPLGKVVELGGGEPKSTNNRMEITAALEALLSLTRVKTLSTKEISLYTDSTYVIKSISSWIFGWERNGWKNSEGKEVSNRDLWERLLDVIRTHQFNIEWLYVPGHMGYAGNERCDEIAVAYSKGWSIELYNGPRSNYSHDLSNLPKPPPLSESAPKKKKGPPIYLSLVDGVVHRDKDWKSCEARVKGRPGVKFKKVESPEDEQVVLKSWGKL